MEIKEYTHYGIKVTKQIDYSENGRVFLDTLEHNGISYEEMPTPTEISRFTYTQSNIYIYTCDGVKKYALVFDRGIYITTAIPDDMDWLALVNDIDQQEKGEEPQRMHTQFYLRLMRAEKKVNEQNKEVWDNHLDPENFENWNKSIEEIIPGFWGDVSLEMRRYYMESEIRKYGYAAWDVEDWIVDKILNFGL